MHCVVFLHPPPIARNKVAWYILSQLELTVFRRVLVPAYEVLNVVAFTNVMHNVIESELLWCVSLLVCLRLSAFCVDIVVSFVHGSVRHTVFTEMRVFWPWLRCSSVDWYGVSNFSFVLRWLLTCLVIIWLSWMDIAKGASDYYRLSHYSLCHRGFEWWTIDVIKLSHVEPRWRIANFPILVFFGASLRRFHLLTCVWSRSRHLME